VSEPLKAKFSNMPKSQNFLLVTAIFVIFSTAGYSQIIHHYNFDGSIPSNMTTTGIGASQSLNSSIVYSGSHSLQITTSAPSGLTFATANLQMSDPISALTYNYYDAFGSSSPFYMYLFLGPATLAWQDAGLAGNTLIYGGVNLPGSPVRVPGSWNTVSVNLFDNAITYSLNSNFIGYYLHDKATSPITLAGFGIASAGPGTYSMYIDNVTVTTVPEPSTWALLLGGAAAGLLRFARKRRA
jgi:hypothetical protein